MVVGVLCLQQINTTAKSSIPKATSTSTTTAHAITMPPSADGICKIGMPKSTTLVAHIRIAWQTLLATLM